MSRNRIREIAAVIALAIGGLGVAEAQSSPARDQKPRPSARKSKTKGASDGIKVKGWWTIDVKNPDGTVASHTEFENSIQSIGMLGLASLLAGTSSSGGLAIMLDGTSTQLSRSGYEYSNSTPCGICIIAASSSSISNFLPVSSSNLTMSGPTLNAATADSFLGTAQVTLAGSVTMTSTGTITDAETVLTSCLPIITPQACAGSSNAGFFYVFTQKTMDGVGSDPSPVTVTKGQVVGITVTLTFQ